jgi:hypothetical protein
VNGTLTNRGDLIEDVVPLVRGLLRTCPCNFLCADTFGTLARVGAEAQVVRSGEDKRKVVEDPKGRPLDEVREIRVTLHGGWPSLTPAQDATPYSFHWPGTPLSSCVPRSSNAIPEPTTASFTV